MVIVFFFSVYFKHTRPTIMAATENIARLSTRATAAEQVLQLLRQQVDAIRLAGVNSAGKGPILPD